MRITEKYLRDEVTNRCIEFLDVAINFILYIEQIYSSDLFEKRLKYNQIVYECQDPDVQNYISDFLNQIKLLFRKQLIDQIGFVIMTNNETEILRRYILEFHQILNQSLNITHQNGNELLAELDSIFSTCLVELIRQIPISPLIISTENNDENEENEDIQWKLQIRLCQYGNTKYDIEENICEQFKLIDNIQMPLKQIKSLHSQRLNIQLMCQNKK